MFFNRIYKQWRLILKVLLALIAVAMVVAFAWLVLHQASRLGWTYGRIYVGIFLAASTTNLGCLARWNPELIERRMRIGKGTKTWDKVWLVLFVLAVIGIFAVVTIDPGDGSATTPDHAWLIGYIIFVFGWVLIIWSMVINPFFEKTVRIQADHGHYVIDTGPYAYLRHPGYLGIAGLIISTPLLLASTWAFVPAILTVLLLVVRTALEARMLINELPGYREYAGRVGYRLIPGVW